MGGGNNVGELIRIISYKSDSVFLYTEILNLSLKVYHTLFSSNLNQVTLCVIYFTSCKVQLSSTVQRHA